MCLTFYSTERFHHTLPLQFFREVFKARDKKGKVVVAMKKVLMENEKEGVGLFFC